MPRLRPGADNTAADAGGDGTLPALLDGTPAQFDASGRAYHRAGAYRLRAAGCDVLDGFDDRREGRHHAGRGFVFGAEGTGSAEHGRVGRGDRFRHRRGAALPSDRIDLRARALARGGAATPSSPPFRDHRTVASLVDDGGLCFWSFRRLCETRRSCHDRSRDRGLRPDGADLRACLDRFDPRPRGGMGAPRPALDADAAGIRAARELRGVRAGQHAASRRVALPALRRRPASSASRMPSPAPGRC